MIVGCFLLLVFLGIIVYGAMCIFGRKQLLVNALIFKTYLYFLVAFFTVVEAVSDPSKSDVTLLQTIICVVSIVEAITNACQYLQLKKDHKKE